MGGPAESITEAPDSLCRAACLQYTPKGAADPAPTPVPWAEELRPGPIEHIDRDYDQGCSPQMVIKTQITANPIGQTMLL